MAINLETIQQMSLIGTNEDYVTMHKIFTKLHKIVGKEKDKAGYGNGGKTFTARECEFIENVFNVQISAKDYNNNLHKQVNDE